MGLDVGDDFFEALEDGVVLCRFVICSRFYLTSCLSSSTRLQKLSHGSVGV